MDKKTNDHNEWVTERDLIEYFHTGSKETQNWSIGTENEKFLFYRDSLEPINYYGPNGIEEIFKFLMEVYSWQPIHDKDYVIGLNDKDHNSSISLEPGGQIELSGSLCKNLHQTNEEFLNYHKQLKHACDTIGVDALGLGFTPKWDFSDMTQVPKTRYHFMRKYMPTVGSLGLYMMHCSATTQVNLDYGSEQDFYKKFRVAMSLQPLVSMLFYNSPFRNGKSTNLLSNRISVWKDTDNDRCGYLPFAFEKDLNFEKYANYALNVPMYFIYRNGKYIIPKKMLFKEYLQNGFRDEEDIEYYPSLEDWETHLSTLFPQVRLKKFIEMRGADSGNHASIISLASIWTGMMYSSSSLDASYDLVKEWTLLDVLEFENNLNKSGFDAKFQKFNITDLISEIIAISLSGLNDRNIYNNDQQTEEIYMRPLQDILNKKETPSDDLIKRFNTVWSQDINNIYNYSNI
ncbi:MAG: glutamate-cysteine ligase family protein [Hyphomicrobiales bacterium]